MYVHICMMIAHWFVIKLEIVCVCVFYLGGKEGQVLSLPRLGQFASHKVYSITSLFMEEFMFLWQWRIGVLSSTSADDTLLSAECIFSKYIFFRNGELQVVSVSQAQKCTKGCNVATKRLTCLITYVFHFSNDKTSVSASNILLTAVQLTTASPSKQDGEKLLQGGDLCIIYIPFDAA